LTYPPQPKEILVSNALRSAGRVTALTLALLLGSLFLLLSLGGAVGGVLNNFTGNWNGEADLITPRVPFGESWADIGKSDGAQYSGVLISSDDALTAPRALLAGDAALTSLVAIVGSLLVLVLAIRLLMRRSFSRIARWGLGVLGILLMVKAAVGPQLRVLSVDLAVQELGYPIATDGGSGMMTENSPELLNLGLWDPVWALARVDLTLFLLGAIVAVVGFLVADGVRLQRETDGLI
jgi:hypothetical protein